MSIAAPELGANLPDLFILSLFYNITLAAALLVAYGPNSFAVSPGAAKILVDTAAEGHIDALHPLKEAAEQHDSESMYRLGVLAFEGKLVQKDMALAADLFRRAADQEHVRAQNAYGYMLQHGLGIGMSEQEAALWYGRAAAAGDATRKTTWAGFTRKGEA